MEDEQKWPLEQIGGQMKKGRKLLAINVEIKVIKQRVVQGDKRTVSYYLISGGRE